MTLSKRLDTVGKRINPNQNILYCTWFENADGSDLRRYYPSCVVGLADPTGEDCDGCQANKIIVTFIGTDEDIAISEARKAAGEPRHFQPPMLTKV